MAENDDAIVVFGDEPSLSTAEQVEVGGIENIAVYSNVSADRVLIEIDYYNGDEQSHVFTQDEYLRLRELRPGLRLPGPEAGDSPSYVNFTPSYNTTGKITYQPPAGEAKAKKANPPVSAETDTERGWLDSVETGLDIAGLVPGLGSVTGLAGALFFMATGNWAQAGSSLLSAIPGLGTISKGAKLGVKGYRLANRLKKAGAAVAGGSRARPGSKAGAKQGSKTATDETASVASAGAIIQGRAAEVADYDRCRLKPYNELECDESKGKRRDKHHVLPNRAFQLGKRADNLLMPGGVPEDKGLSICLDSNKLGKESEHNSVHEAYREAEKLLGADRCSPKGLALLDQIEDAAAEAIEKGTEGLCKKEDIKKQLRDYHKNKFDLHPDTCLRASVRPSKDPEIIKKMGTRAKPTITGRPK